MRIAKKMKRGFTLVELMIVVAIVGVLAALAIYGVSRYLRSAKTAEARNSLGQMAKDAVSAFDRESMTADVLALGKTSGTSHSLCKSAAKSVPEAKASIKGEKYQSSPSEWSAGDAATGWQCLRFSMDAPQYFMYSYTADKVGEKDGTFTAKAEGDLDGDGTTSTFSLGGKIVQDTGEALSVVVAPSIAETSPDE